MRPKRQGEDAVAHASGLDVAADDQVHTEREEKVPTDEPWRALHAACPQVTACAARYEADG